MRIGIEATTSYAVVNGTKSFTITGLSGKLTKQSFRNVVLQRTSGNIALINFAIDELELLTLTLNTGVYTVDYSGLTRAASLPTLATGNILAIEVLVDGESITVTNKLDAIKNQTQSIETKVDTIQQGVDNLTGVPYTDTLTVNNGSIGYYYSSRALRDITFTGATITEIRKVYTNGNEETVSGAFSVNAGMGIKIYFSNTPPVSIVLHAYEVAENKTRTQDIPLAASPYSGLPYIGHCVWDTENQKMILVQNGSTGINTGMYENSGKIIQEFESKFGALATATFQMAFNVNTPNFYYITTSQGIIWYNKTTKAFGTHGIALQYGGLLYIDSLNKVIVFTASTTLGIIDTNTNIYTTITLTSTCYSGMYCPSISRLAVVNYSSAKLMFVDLSTPAQDGAEITTGATNVRFVNLSVDGLSLYLSGVSGTVITKILLSTRAVTNKTTNATSLSLRAIYEYGGYVYVLCSDNRTWVGNATTLADVKFIANTTHGNSALRIGNKVYTANFTAPGYIGGLDLSTETPITATAVNDTPCAIVLHPNNNQLYVGCNNNQNGLSIIQL